MTVLHWMPAHELVAMIRRREIKLSELMATIARIERLNPKLDAFCAMRSDLAMAETFAMDESADSSLSSERTLLVQSHP
jgi:Asp-tRNA(Asn)/Glu-tRNA(Gln) amidotransferase A subunit family amidase